MVTHDNGNMEHALCSLLKANTVIHSANTVKAREFRPLYYTTN